MNISLKINKGFKWFSNESIFIKGYFYDEKNVFYEKEKALKYLLSIKTKDDFLKLISKINGIFSIVITIDKETYIATDITRSFPLFYTFNNDEIFISDAILDLKNKLSINNFNSLAITELKSSNHTHGNKTLLNTIFQVQANEYLIIKNNEIINSDFFFTYATKKESSTPYLVLKKEAIIAFENAFKRLTESFNNKMVVIPLSGGFDSRLIAVFLKKYNYKNVVCYTYGNTNSIEIKNSKKVANKLGFKWFFIEYDINLIANFAKSNDFKEFAHFAGKFSSTPNLQEYFAVKYLSENNLINKDAVFIPGYAGDVLGGSQFLKVIPEDLKIEEIVDLILTSKFSNYNISQNKMEKLRTEIENNLNSLDKNYHLNTPSSVFENYDITEKFAKYIFNSASFYTFFGYEYRVPYWDKELLLFFKKVPQKYKLLKLLFDDVLIEEYFKKFDVYFNEELQPNQKEVTLQKIKDKIKPFFPTFIKQKILKKNDWNNYQPITNQLLLEITQKGLKVNRKSKDYNEIIAQWYIYLCQNKLN